MIHVTLDAPRKGLQNPLNVQKLLTNVDKIIKLYLQICLSYPIKITICFSLNEHTLNILSHILYPLNYIKTTFSLLIATLYCMFSMQWNMDFCS
jgi:hypothetical protein